MAFSSFGVILTLVGKPAPPRPTIPACFTISRISALEREAGSLSSPNPSTARYSPSFSTMMDMTLLPFTIMRGSIFFTLPETEQFTTAEMNPPASAIFCPTSTSSPTFTSGFAGAPMCCESGYTISPDVGFSWVTGLSIESSLPSNGWTPPLNVANPIRLPSFL